MTSKSRKKNINTNLKKEQTRNSSSGHTKDLNGDHNFDNTFHQSIDKSILDYLKQNLFRQIIIQNLKRGFLFFAILLAIYIIAFFLCHQRIWTGYETLYYPLQLAKNWAPTVIVGVVGILVAKSLLSAWKKTFDYLYEVMDAMNNIYSENDDVIVMSDDLKDLNVQLNFLKLSIQKNQYVAKEAEQRKNDLVVYLAHDLKTPLTSVIGYLSLLRDERNISPKLQEKYIQISLAKAERLEDLINEFFDITRFNLTTLTLESSTVNLSRMLEQIIYEFQPMFLEKNLNCDLQIPANLMMTCDVDKMQRVFDNLLKNAVNYCYNDTTITITITVEANHLHIHFANQGHTIPQEKLDRIFEQFFRLDSARTSRTGGSGLGLAIAKEIVELHGGTITASSAEEWIHFYIDLPQK